VIRLLREQNDPEHLGEIPVTTAKEILLQKGIVGDIEYLSVENVVQYYLRPSHGEFIPWFRLVWEYEKTEEYKEHLKEETKKAREKETHYLQFIEELEEENRKANS
jgi:hypothetical protein